jgi:hypothetical protein
MFGESGETEKASEDDVPLTIDSAAYILYQCGQPQPDDQYTKQLNATMTVHYLEIPVSAVATADSTVGWMLVRSALPKSGYTEQRLHCLLAAHPNKRVGYQRKFHWS